MTTSLAPAPVASAGSLSPSSSPRLPSPPPFPEIQLSPKSPQSGAKAGSRSHDFDTSLLDNGASRRIRPGTKAADMASGPPLIPLSDVSQRGHFSRSRLLFHRHSLLIAHSSTLLFNYKNISRPSITTIPNQTSPPLLHPLPV